MENQKNYKGILILLIVINIILIGLCILLATETINFKSNNIENNEINQNVNENIKDNNNVENNEEENLVTDSNQSIESIIPPKNNEQEDNSRDENNIQETVEEEEPEVENEIVDVKEETWLKLLGGWKTETMDKPGLTYVTPEEMEKYQDEYANVYNYLYFADDYKLFYSYCAINKLLNHDDYTSIKVIDATHIDVKGTEHYISTLDENTLVIDGIKFVKNNEIKSSDFYDNNGNYCVLNYHCPIYSK